jgi:hypothetical protein
VHRVRKGLLEIEGRRPAHSYFEKLPLVDEDLEIVLAASSEDLGADGGLEATALLGRTDQSLIIQSKFVARLLGVPVEQR